MFSYTESRDFAYQLMTGEPVNCPPPSTKGEVDLKLLSRGHIHNPYGDGQDSRIFEGQPSGSEKITVPDDLTWLRPIVRQTAEEINMIFADSGIVPAIFCGITRSDAEAMSLNNRFWHVDLDDKPLPVAVTAIVSNMHPTQYYDGPHGGLQTDLDHSRRVDTYDDKRWEIHGGVKRGIDQNHKIQSPEPGEVVYSYAFHRSQPIGIANSKRITSEDWRNYASREGNTYGRRTLFVARAYLHEPDAKAIQNASVLKVAK